MRCVCSSCSASRCREVWRPRHSALCAWDERLCLLWQPGTMPIILRLYHPLTHSLQRCQWPSLTSLFLTHIQRRSCRSPVVLDCVGLGYSSVTPQTLMATVKEMPDLCQNTAKKPCFFQASVGKAVCIWGWMEMAVKMWFPWYLKSFWRWFWQINLVGLIHWILISSKTVYLIFKLVLGIRSLKWTVWICVYKQNK